jgi:hypothetical protein
MSRGSKHAYSHVEYHTAFAQTNYVVFVNDDKTLLIRANQGNNHLLTYFAHLKSWAFITAWNPLPYILDIEENRNRNNELEKDIYALNLDYYPGSGISVDENWEEESFFIINCSKEEAEKLALKYNQLAFVYGEAGEVAQIVYLK